MYKNYNLVDIFNYTTTIHWPDGNISQYDILVNVSAEIPMILLDLWGYECQQVDVEVSMPGNCEPYALTAALLLEPAYPLPQQAEVTALNSTTAVLTWQHPHNLFTQSSFSYDISAVVTKTGYVIKDYNTVIRSSDTPMEEFDLSDIEVCEEINFTLSLANDCRKNWTSFILPICKNMNDSFYCVY